MPASDRISVLVVEDHAETLDLMCEMLGANGYDVVGVATAEEGIEELRSRRHAVVVTDHWLDRGRTGTWMLCTAANEGLLERTAAIMCSAERRLEGVPHGVPVLTKPLDFAKLALGDRPRDVDPLSDFGLSVFTTMLTGITLIILVLGLQHIHS